MIKPLFKFKTRYFYQEFAMVSFVTAISALIAIKTNDSISKKSANCKRDKSKTLRCSFLTNENYSNFEIFLITFVSTFMSYLVLYIFFGYGFKD